MLSVLRPSYSGQRRTDFEERVVPDFQHTIFWQVQNNYHIWTI